MRVRIWSDWGNALAGIGQCIADCFRAINQFFSKHIWILSGVAWAALVGGWFPFVMADIFVDGEDSTYAPALLIMMLIAGAWGYLVFLWIVAFTSCRWFSKVVQLILVLTFFLAVSFLLYNVHRLPVYAAFLLPSLVMLFCRGKLVWDGVCGVILAASLALVLQPDLRIAYFSRAYNSGCLCCGSKQRAIGELLHLGPNGREALLQCVIRKKAAGWDDELRIVRNLILEELPAQGPAELMDYRERIKKACAPTR